MTATAHYATFDWEPKRAQTLRKARRRSRLIGLLRRGFVAAAGASFAAVFVFMTLHAIQGVSNAGQYAAAEPLRMINPRFIGQTENGGPYQLSAEMAERQPGEGQPIELVAPVYRTEAGTIMLAPRGIYDEAAQTVVFDFSGGRPRVAGGVGQLAGGTFQVFSHVGEGAGRAQQQGGGEEG